MPNLFSPIQVGSVEANNRVFMAPVTRARATKDAVPTEIMATYYKQRASAGLIISEAVGISRSGLGWPHAPGIWSKEQVEKWKPITKAVHDEGGKIVIQLWHMGRAVHSSVTGSQPVSSSATSYPLQLHTYDGKKSPEVAHSLTVDEIKQIVKDYAVAAKNSIDAGFDGIQVHAANGYLIDQFIRDNTNHRTDEYGGSVENRLRFLDEVIAAIVDAIGADKTSVRLSPNGEIQGVDDSNPEATFTAAAKVLENRKVSMLELRESNTSATFFTSTETPQLHDAIRRVYSGVLVLNQDYSRDQALKAVENGTADAISFGRAFMSNPTLVQKLKDNVPLVEWGDYRKAWLYSQSPEGYTTFN